MVGGKVKMPTTEKKKVDHLGLLFLQDKGWGGWTTLGPSPKSTTVSGKVCKTRGEQ